MNDSGKSTDIVPTGDGKGLSTHPINFLDQCVGNLTEPVIQSFVPQTDASRQLERLVPVFLQPSQSIVRLRQLICCIVVQGILPPVKGRSIEFEGSNIQGEYPGLLHQKLNLAQSVFRPFD